MSSAHSSGVSFLAQLNIKELYLFTLLIPHLPVSLQPTLNWLHCHPLWGERLARWRSPKIFVIKFCRHFSSLILCDLCILWHHGPLFRETFSSFCFPDTHSYVCISYLSPHYLLMTLKIHIPEKQILGSLESFLGSLLTRIVHTQSHAFDDHLYLIILTSLYWVQMCLLSSRSIVNCPLSISRWIFHKFPQLYTYKIEFDIFFLQICIFSGVLNSIFVNTILPIVQPETLGLSLTFTSFFSI